MRENIKKVLCFIKKLVPYFFLIVSNILFCISYYILKVLKMVNVYEIYYYFKSDTTGTSTHIILDGVKVCIPLFILLIIILIVPMKVFKNKFLVNHKILYSFLIFLVSLVTILKTINFDRFYVNTLSSTTIYEDYYKDTNEVKVTFPEEKKNLIILYLESMESSLFSKKNGGAFETTRIKELENLALDNINFSNSDKLGGAYNLTSTGWTIASLVSTTSGTPLMTTVRNRYREINDFMPNVNTLGDILKSEGYNLEIIQGSNIKFSGTDKYLKTHGNYTFLDYKEAKRRNYIDKDYDVWWGFEDKKVFEYSKGEIMKLASEDKPFAVSIFTMDTHFKDGYLDPSCEENFDDQYSNVYACSSKMVNDFINFLKETEIYKNTTIVVIGDHISMQNSYYNDYPDYERTIYNAFINSSVEEVNNKNRKFSSLDMYPTILASMGAKIEGERLGFGVNLFSGEKTLIEELGRKKFDEELLKSSKYYSENIMSYDYLNNLN